MIINTNVHLSDEANSFVFIKNGTIWENDPTVNDVQEVVDSIHPYAIDGYPRATSSIFGIVILAEDEDLIGGGNDSVMTNSLLIKSVRKPYANNKEYGTVILSKNADFDNSGNKTAMTNKVAQYARKKMVATTTNFGTVKFATDAEVRAGTITNKAMTPKQLKEGINQKHTPSGIATEKVRGTVRLTTINDNYNGLLNNGFALSPYSLMNTKATDKKMGLIRLSTTNEYSTNLDNVAVTPELMKNDIISIRSMSNKYNATKGNFDDFMIKRPKIIKDIVDELWGEFDENGIINEFIGIGSIHTSFSELNNDSFMVPMGQELSVEEYPELFKVLGYENGGSGNTFKLPDTRGLFFKMHGISRVITDSPMSKFTQEITKMFQVQDDRIGGHKHAGWSGSQENNWYNGSTTSKDWYGSGGGDWDNATSYTSDGTNMNSSGNELDPYYLIGEETRPWNMPLKIYMRVK